MIYLSSGDTLKLTSSVATTIDVVVHSSIDFKLNASKREATTITTATTVNIAEKPVQMKNVQNLSIKNRTGATTTVTILLNNGTTDFTLFSGQLAVGDAVYYDQTGVFYILDATGSPKPDPDVYQRSNILGTVSQTGGVPTGAIVERGSNANGDYVRFADGTQICQAVLTSTAVSTASGGLFTNATEIGWTFPANFATGTEVALGGGVKSVSVVWLNARRITHSTANIRLISTTSLASGPDFNVFAVGRWF